MHAESPAEAKCRDLFVDVDEEHVRKPATFFLNFVIVNVIEVHGHGAPGP
jgi:hypothetical protein